MSASVGFNTCISSASQYKQVFDEAIKKSVFANSPVTVEIGLKLENSCNKGEFIKKLFDEMDKNNAWGKFAFRLQGTEISSKDVASICQEMEKRKDKPLNIQFDNKINKFSSDDYLNIFAATLGSQTTCFPFMSEQNCPVSEELLDTFKDRTPNIIEGSSGQKNLRIIHQSCGYQDVAQMQKDITQTCQNGMPLKEFVAQKVHKMDEGYLLMLQERQSAIDWVSKSHDTLDKQALMQGQKNSYRAFFELLNDAVKKEIEIRNKENHNVETASREQTEVQNKTTLEEYTETIDKANASTYDEFMIATQTHNHQNMWALAQKLENENEIFDGWQNQIASEIAIENPRFNTNEVFQKITENVQNNFNCFEKSEESLSKEEVLQVINDKIIGWLNMLRQPRQSEKLPMLMNQNL